MIIQNTQSATYLQALLYNLSINNANNTSNVSQTTLITDEQQVLNQQLEEQAYNVTLSDNAIAMAQEENQDILFDNVISQEVSAQNNYINQQLNSQDLTNTDLVDNLANSLQVSQTINTLTGSQSVITGTTIDQSSLLMSNVSSLIDINNGISAYQAAVSTQIPTTQDINITAQTTLSDTAYGLGITVDQAA